MDVHFTSSGLIEKNNIVSSSLEIELTTLFHVDTKISGDLPSAESQSTKSSWLLLSFSKASSALFSIDKLLSSVQKVINNSNYL